MSGVSTKSWREWPLVWPIAGLILTLGFNLFVGGNFFSVTVQDGHLYGNLVDILNQGARVMLLALGMTLVIATGGVDLSVGSVMAIAGSLATTLVVLFHQSFAVGLVCALGASALLGLANGSLIVFGRAQPFIATLILMVAGRGIAQLITVSEVLIFKDETFASLGQGYFLYLPVSLWLVAGVFAVMALAIRRTALGLMIEAVGDNEPASRFAGIDAGRLKLIVYAVSGLLAGLAGILETSSVRAADPMRLGELRELDAIFAVVVGGTALTGGRFLLTGSLLGAILMQALTVTLYNVGVPSAVAPAYKAAAIVAVCLLQSPKFRARALALFRVRRS